MDVVLDTNVFVAAGFNEDSSSARIIHRVRDGDLRMRWNDATRGETRYIVKKIPPLSWAQFEDLFRNQERFSDETEPDRFDAVPDPPDREFAALAHATDAVLITNDDDLLAQRDKLSVTIKTPQEFAGKS